MLASLYYLLLVEQKIMAHCIFILSVKSLIVIISKIEKENFLLNKEIMFCITYMIESMKKKQ